MSVGINDPQVQRIISDANRGITEAPEGPSISEPSDTVFTLAAGYMQDDGHWTKEFEVRELTGRDEEALARINDIGRSLAAIVERGVVRLGIDEATPDRINSLIGGDWDTVLLAVRAVTFGPDIEIKPTCQSCQAKYEATVNILTDLPIRTANPEDLSWTVKGKRSTYEVSLYNGATQRRVFDLLSDNSTVAVINTEILHDSIDKIDDMPVLGRDAIRDLPMADRRALLDSIQNHRVGPDLLGVKIKCPTCGHEQPYPLTTAALFRWN